MTEEGLQHQLEDEAEITGHGIKVLKTCTPYLAGNTPKRGDHCAWMESSAVVYCNSVIGARTNTEGRESTSAAMLTKRIPDWGFHQDAFRRGTHHIEVEAPVSSVFRSLSTAKLRSSANGTVAVALGGNGSSIPCPRNAPFSKTAIGPRSSRPALALVKRATRNGCELESGTPPSGANKYTASPGTRWLMSSTIVALASGTVTRTGS